MIRRIVLLIVMAALLWPAAVLAQDSTDESDDDVLIRINGPVTVAADETLDVLIVINDDALVEGVVDEALVVVRGTATINGRINGDLVVVRGDLILGPNAVVEDVHLYDSTIARDPASTILGDLTEDAEFKWSWWGIAILSFGFWIGMTIVVLVAGLLFALFGARQLFGLGETAGTQVSSSIVTSLALLVGLPILAFITFFTIVGIPLGLAILFVVIPLLWLLGYIVIGASLGRWIRASMGRTDHRGGIVWATLIGLLILQLINLVPFVGGVIVFVAGVYGAGVLVLYMIRRRGSEPVAPVTSGVTAPAATE